MCRESDSVASSEYRGPQLMLVVEWSPFFLFFLMISTFNYYLFIFWAVLGLRFCARASSSCSKRGPFFIAVRGPLTAAASLVAEHGLQTRRLSSCGSRAQPLRGTWDPPKPGLEPVSPALAGRFSTTAPSGKPWMISFCTRLWKMPSDFLSTGSVVVAHGLSCSAACGVFPDQGSNPCPLHWHADS